MEIKRITHPKITTKGDDGAPNGFLVPIFNIHETPIDEAQRPEQVYLTVVSQARSKGPHLHMRRWGLFTCVKGDVKIVVKVDDRYEEHFSGENYDYASIQIPAGVPAEIRNVGDGDAYVLNTPSPAWRPDAQDEHHVSFTGCPL